MSAIARIIIELLVNLLVVRSADGLATLWNYCMDAIAPFLTLDVLTEMTSGHVAFFNTITESLRVVGFALTILLWLYGILRVESTLAEMKRPEAVFKHMLRLIIMI